MDQLQPRHAGPRGVRRGDLGTRDLGETTATAATGTRGVPPSSGGGPMQEGHVPVLAEEVVAMLAAAPGSLQIDATVGGGGHAERILAATDPDGRLLGLDAD